MGSGIRMDDLHLLVLLVQVGVSVLVLCVLLQAVWAPFMCTGMGDWPLLEMIWTVVPSIILFILGVPRLELLYKFEGIFIKPDLIVKVVGHQ